MLKPSESLLTVRRSILVRASPDKVWEKFTSLADMSDWWGHRVGAPEAGTDSGQILIAYEPELGSQIEMAVMMDGKPAHFGGTIVEFSYAEALTYENDWIPNQGWESPTMVSIRLTANAGETMVELFHYGFENTGGDVSATHAGYEAGWGMTQLQALKHCVENDA